MYKVILVDDEIYVRKGLRSLIDWQECGFEVVEEASNGQQALTVIRDVKPDLVVIDIRMPILDGLGLIKIVSQEEEIQPKFIIISGYSDFKYAQTALKYGVHDFILKPIDKDEMEQTLTVLSKSLNKQKTIQEKNREIKYKEIMHKLIFGKADEKEVTNYLPTLGNPKEFYYIIIEVNGLINNTYEKNVAIYKNVGEKIAKVIRDICDLKEKVWVQDLEQGSFGVLITANYLNRFQMKIGRFVHWVKEELSHQISEEVTFYVGSSVPDLRILKESYETAQRGLQFKYLQKDGIIFSSDINVKSLHYTELDDSFYHLVLEKIVEESSDSIRDIIDSIFEEFHKKSMARSAILSSINRIVHSVLKFIKKLEGDPSQLDSFQTMLKIQEFNVTLVQLKELLIHFILESKKEITELRRFSTQSEVYKIKQYIDSNYHENISLKSIAAKFYMNPVYLGQLFKKTYGIYFKDYLLQIRITEAKRLLRQSENRIYEIAECVGFNNTDYFVTIFGKLENITPSEYRNHLKRKV
ncbi:response regulator [Neobacillus niacini]|uniref:response regulator transcription factor n=1 Tax=Neobacillus niacini TaxID=86668 RepID=UPI001C8F0DA3|nr:response regulator [Neobacillus niacini]MBY0146983.1 response regulator [Neobacillus niacini]